MIFVSKFEEFTKIHLGDKTRDFFVVQDDNPKFLTVCLPMIHLATEGGGVGVWRVTP